MAAVFLVSVCNLVKRWRVLAFNIAFKTFGRVARSKCEIDGRPLKWAEERKTNELQTKAKTIFMPICSNSHNEFVSYCCWAVFVRKCLRFSLRACNMNSNH